MSNLLEHDKPLAGVLVVTIEQAVAAPLCTVRLADAGARVIKIERLDGETARHYDGAVDGMSAYFVWLNRGKESAALDLKSTVDLALLHRMVAKADVLVQNLAPGAIDRLGLGGKILSARFPRLIAVNIVGYSQQSPYCQMRAYDMLVQAESGLCSVTGTADYPCKVGVSVADIATGMNAHAAILEAIIDRTRSGFGRVIEIAMFDGMADWMTVPLLHYEHAGRTTGRYGLTHASIYPYRPYTCAGGRMVIVAIQHDGEWKRFCRDVLQREDLLADRRFTTNALRVANRDALDAEIEPAFAKLTYEQAIKHFEDAQIAWGKLTSIEELPFHPALHRVHVKLPSGTQIAVPSPAGRRLDGSSTPWVPALGVDTERIRVEFSN